MGLAPSCVTDSPVSEVVRVDDESVAERGFSQPLSNQIAASHARARMTARSILRNVCKLLMRELGTERRDNQIGGTVPLPGSGRSFPPSLNYTEQTHHISPPGHPVRSTVSESSGKNTTEHKQQQRNETDVSIPPRRQYKEVLRQASWSQYEASILL